MKKRMVRITGCLLAGALSIGSFGLNTYAAPVAGVSSVTDSGSRCFTGTGTVSCGQQ